VVIAWLLDLQSVPIITVFMSSAQTRCIPHNIMLERLSVTFQWSMVFFGQPVFSTNKTDIYDITEILWKVALNIAALTNNPRFE
jgi:hypothetical protein